MAHKVEREVDFCIQSGRKEKTSHGMECGSKELSVNEMRKKQLEHENARDM